MFSRFMLLTSCVDVARVSGPLQALDVAGHYADDAWESGPAFQTPQVRHVYAFTHRQLPDAFVLVGRCLLCRRHPLFARPTSCSFASLA